jgi:hypothetical protein
METQLEKATLPSAVRLSQTEKEAKEAVALAG